MPRNAGLPDRRSAGGYGQPAGNQGAACNTLKRRDFWQPGKAGGLILSYEKKEGMGGRERRKRWSVGAKAARLARAARNPRKSMARAGTGGRLAGGIGEARISLTRWRRTPPPWSWADADAESLHIAGDFRAGIRSKAEIAETRTAKGVPAKNVPPVCPRKKCAPRGMPGRVLTH